MRGEERVVKQISHLLNYCSADPLYLLSAICYLLFGRLRKRYRFVNRLFPYE